MEAGQGLRLTLPGLGLLNLHPQEAKGFMTSFYGGVKDSSQSLGFELHGKMARA